MEVKDGSIEFDNASFRYARQSGTDALLNSEKVY